MLLTLRRPTGTSATLFCAFALGIAGSAFAGSVDDNAARAVSREQSELDAGAGARLAALSGAIPPHRPGQDAAVVVASRGGDPLTAAPASRTSRKPVVVPLDFGTLDAMSKASGDAQWQCLAQAIYFESRGEPLEGQIAVAEVVLNRVDAGSFPGTVCGVTHQGVGSGRGCQFSYACDGNSDVMKSALSRERSEKLASLMLAGRARTVTAGATYFHTRSIRPDWSRRFTRTAAIGHHIFYRDGSFQVAGG